MTHLDARRGDLVPLYDQLAASYDVLHQRWLRCAGGEAQSALEAAVRAVLRPGDRLLDVGCGTGAFARRLLREGFAAQNLALVDPSVEMLHLCDDIPCYKVNGRLDALPFEAAEFDVVTCAWVIETVPDPARAIAELCRMTRDGGTLCIAFCAEKPCRSIWDWCLKRTLIWRGTGRFIRVEDIVRYICDCGNFCVQEVPLSGPASMIVARRVMAAPVTA